MTGITVPPTATQTVQSPVAPFFVLLIIFAIVLYFLKSTFQLFVVIPIINNRNAQLGLGSPLSRASEES